jgi:hypothetical protein
MQRPKSELPYWRGRKMEDAMEWSESSRAVLATVLIETRNPGLQLQGSVLETALRRGLIDMKLFDATAFQVRHEGYQAAGETAADRLTA